ncbi:MAG: hypothetical protein ABI321_23130 [Polyangia bacterium]
MRTGLVIVCLVSCAATLRAETFPVEPGAARAELARLVAVAEHADPSLPIITTLETRPYSADAYRKLFLAMWAQVPDWKSGDPLWARRSEPPLPARVAGQPRPKRPPPHDPERIDWFDALLGVNLAELEVPFTFQEMPKVELPAVAPADREGLRADALYVVATMRALAATHRAEAVAPIFKLAFVLDGVFRDECGKQLRAIGDAAVAPLVRLQYARVIPGVMGAKQRRYAVYQLDRMDRARPLTAITTAPDDRLRAVLIHAYGEARALDAVEAILDQINAQSHRVRREARWAFRRYVEGPAPPPAPMRKRKLPGGQMESDEKPDYLTYREVADLALQKRIAELAITMPVARPPAMPLAMFEAIVAHDDAERNAEWERAFVTARAQIDAGDLDGALGNYEWILAHDPSSSRRAEMSPTFARAGDARRRAGKLDEAAALYWKAAALATPDAAPKLEAEASFVDAERARARGQTDEAALRRAIALDPTQLAAKAQLAQLEARRALARRGRRLGALAGGLGVLIAAGWFVLRRRSRA